MNTLTSKITLIFICLLYSHSLFALPPTYTLQLTLADKDLDSRVSDTFTQITGAVRYNHGLSRNSVLALNADISTTSHNDLDDSDFTGLLGEVIYSYIPTAGFTKPVYSVGLRYAIENYDNNDQDLSITTLFATDTLRLSDRTAVTVGLELIDKSSDLADSSITGLFASVDLRGNDKTTFYALLKLQDEDSSISAAALTSPRAARTDISGSHLPGEPGYTGPPVTSTSGSNLPDSDTTNTIVLLGVNYFINSQNAIDFSVEKADYDGDTDTTREIISLDYFYKF